MPALTQRKCEGRFT